MDFTELKQKALDLLEPFEQIHHSTLSNVHWVEHEQSSIDGDYCENCIDEALKDAIKEHKKKSAEIKKKYKTIEETGLWKGVDVKSKYSRSQINESKLYELKELGKNKYDYTFNYGGGYESDSFKTCDSCGNDLDITILPNDQELGYVLSDLKNGRIDDQIGYRAYWLIYNAWDKEERFTYKNGTVLTKKLIDRVIEIFEKEI